MTGNTPVDDVDWDDAEARLKSIADGTVDGIILSSEARERLSQRDSACICYQNRSSLTQCSYHTILP